MLLRFLRTIFSNSRLDLFHCSISWRFSLNLPTRFSMSSFSVVSSLRSMCLERLFMTTVFWTLLSRWLTIMPSASLQRLMTVVVLRQARESFFSMSVFMALSSLMDSSMMLIVYLLIIMQFSPISLVMKSISSLSWLSWCTRLFVRSSFRIVSRSRIFSTFSRDFTLWLLCSMVLQTQETQITALSCSQQRLSRSLWCRQTGSSPRKVSRFSMFFLARSMFSSGKMSKSLKLSSLQISSSDCRIRKESFVLYFSALPSLPCFSFPSTFAPSFFAPFGVDARQELLLTGVFARVPPPVLFWKSIQNNNKIITNDLTCPSLPIILSMDLQQNNKERFVFPGEGVGAGEGRYNPGCFYEEGGALRALYFGYLLGESGGQQCADIIRKSTTYIPEVNQFVVAIVKGKTADSFLLDLNAPLDGTLGALEFDGVTKRNRPNLVPGDLVYARVSGYSKYLGARLSCLNAGYSAKGALGELKGGMVVYGLRGREKEVQGRLETLGRHCQFEVALGKNDLLWFSCGNKRAEMVLYNIFSELLRGCGEELFQELLKLLPK